MTTRPWTLYALLPLLVIVLAGCQNPEPEPQPIDENLQEPPTAGTVEPEMRNDFADVLEQAINHARSDLATRESVDEEEIRVHESRSVTWANGSLGCPAPDGNYTQALVEGVYIRLGIGDREFHYHGGSNGQARLCPEERRRGPVDREGRALM